MKLRNFGFLVVFIMTRYGFGAFKNHSLQRTAVEDKGIQEEVKAVRAEADKQRKLGHKKFLQKQLTPVVMENLQKEFPQFNIQRDMTIRDVLYKIGEVTIPLKTKHEIVRRFEVFCILDYEYDDSMNDWLRGLDRTSWMYGIDKFMINFEKINSKIQERQARLMHANMNEAHTEKIMQDFLGEVFNADHAAELNARYSFLQKNIIKACATTVADFLRFIAFHKINSPEFEHDIKNMPGMDPLPHLYRVMRVKYAPDGIIMPTYHKYFWFDHPIVTLKSLQNKLDEKILESRQIMQQREQQKALER